LKEFPAAATFYPVLLNLELIGGNLMSLAYADLNTNVQIIERESARARTSSP
jgi:hypothetical protein